MFIIITNKRNMKFQYLTIFTNSLYFSKKMLLRRANEHFLIFMREIASRFFFQISCETPCIKICTYICRYMSVPTIKSIYQYIFFCDSGHRFYSVVFICQSSWQLFILSSFICLCHNLWSTPSKNFCACRYVHIIILIIQKLCRTTVHKNRFI